MAKIRLYDYEVADQLLPNVCMQCGADADLEKRKKFSWYPPWCLFVGGALMAMIMTKRMTVAVPLCREHKNHWLWRDLVIWLGLALCVVLGVAAVIFLVNQRPHTLGETLAGIFCAAAGVIGVGWLVAVIILHHTSIRPVEITDRDITLTNVSSDFVAALRDERRRHPYEEDEEDEEDYPRSRKRGRRAHDYDDEDDYTPPRRRSRRSAYDEDEDDYEDE